MLIAQCVYATATNERFGYITQSLESLNATVDWDKHRLIIINNGDLKECTTFLSALAKKNKKIMVITPDSNLGTAAGINLAIKLRKPNEVVTKTDDDIVWEQYGWADELEYLIKEHPEIGILGLKKEGVWQNPNHINPAYRTKIINYGDGYSIEVCDDIIGSCTALNPLLLDIVGYYNQPTKYGFDDSAMSIRSIVTGFINAFYTDVAIIDLDTGTSAYSEWKRNHAGEYIAEAAAMCKLYQQGILNPYYDGNFSK
jgi:GT2 family glycosyltransferase